MGPAHQRRTTAGAMLALAVLAAGITALTAEPHPVDAAEPGPTADPRPAPDAAEPQPTANCSRGKNLYFDEPAVDPGESRWVPADETGWETTLKGDYEGKVPIARLDEGLSNKPELQQYTGLVNDSPHVLSQSFPTLPGDRIAWGAYYGGTRGRIDALSIGAPGTTTSVDMTHSTNEYPSSPQTRKNHKVDHTRSRTVLSINGADHEDAANIHWVKLDLRCSILIEAAAGALTEVGDSRHVNAGDTVTFTYVVKNTADAAAATGAASLTNVAVAHNLADTTIRCPADKKKLLKPADPNSKDDEMVCTAVYTLTQADIDRGTVTAAATVDADDAVRAAGEADPKKPLDHRVRDSASATSKKIEANPLLTVEKKPVVDMAAAGSADRVDAGDKVTYSFAVTNTGNVTLTEVSVADPKAGEVTCPKTTLAPKASTTCTATYAATAADITAGVIENKATVTAVTPGKKKVAASGSVSVWVAARRIAGAERYSTAVEISKATFAPGVKTAYVATGVNFPDALAGSAASGGDGPILLVTRDAIGGATLTELKRSKPKKIIVLGGTGVVSQSVESALRKEGATTRQSGSDRYSTAAAISAKHFDAGAAVAFVATGEDFPDALTGGPAAAALGGPILLTQKTKLPSATISELKRLKPKRIVVVGGTGVVSEAVEKALASYTAGEVSRLAGADRYSTGGAISRAAFKPGVPVAYIATGLNFPDALAGGAAGAFKDGPVLLVAGGTIPKATAAELTRLKPRSIIVLGGMAVVPKTVETALGAYLAKTP